MDWVSLKGSARESIKKYSYFLMILLAGVFLMVLPEEKSMPQEQEVEDTEKVSDENLQSSLAKILCMIQGAGKVEVLLTESAGEEILYQMDADKTVDTLRQETVIITNTSRDQNGLIKQINPPTYQGALILCQGADNANVRLSIVDAVMSVTGLTSDRITVLKMK